MKKKNTIIFDLDGTLLDTLEDLRDSVNVTLSHFGWETRSLEEIRHFVGNGIRKLMERATPEDCSNEQFEEAFAFFREYYVGHCRIKTKPYEGILKLLASLKEMGYRLAIVSNKNDTAVKELCQDYFKDYVTVAIGEREGVARKPAPDSVFAALKELGSSAEDAVYIGDSEVDYATAKNSELDCILVSWGFRDKELLENLEGVAVVDNCEELLGMIMNL